MNEHKQGSSLQAVVVLLIVVALLVGAIFLAAGEETSDAPREQPTPTEAPIDPGT